ncbi:MAG: type II toxin-antitoxin system VapC family toxin [Betaproteobacteria bacterium]|nr:type II toxin-antitoxin system VapC family toxin [Betaproteobacteria bacterium]
MSAFVLDCSIAAAWLFDDEATTQTDDLLKQLRNGSAFVPNLWHLELGNVLVQAERRKRITSTQISTRLELISRLPIETDTETDSRAFREILALARSETLTTYDAAYLELAIRRGLPLATQDKTLIHVANRIQIRTLPVL